MGTNIRKRKRFSTELVETGKEEGYKGFRHECRQSLMDNEALQNELGATKKKKKIGRKVLAVTKSQ